MDITFYGVRGSTPCSCDGIRRHGGNTSCVLIQPRRGDPIILDLGTGLRYLGLDTDGGRDFRATAFVTHMHWDHIQGLPFFAPVLSERGRLDIHVPPMEDRTIADAVTGFLAPPYFPVSLEEIHGEVSFTEMQPGSIEVGDAVVTAAWVPHNGPTFAYRVEVDGRSVAYVSDHQEPIGNPTWVNPDVLDLCRGVDLLIHDSQFNAAELAMKPNWGHCTHDYALEVAAQAGVSALALFHHDPSHGDDYLDEVLEDLRVKAGPRGVPEIWNAYEGLTVSYASMPVG